jgi:hypothetical protein
MSNDNTKKELIVKELEYFSFLSSKNFLEIIKNENLEYDLYNILLVSHVLAVAYNTSGISEGGITLEYSITWDSNSEYSFDNPPQAKPMDSFFFYTVRNSIIEKKRVANNLKMRNEHFPEIKNGYSFREFIFKYFNKNVKESTEDANKFLKKESDKTRITFKLNKNKRFSINGQMNGYKQLISENKSVKSFLEQFYLNKNLSIKNESIITKKLKI